MRFGPQSSRGACGFGDLDYSGCSRAWCFPGQSNKPGKYKPAEAELLIYIPRSRTDGRMVFLFFPMLNCVLFQLDFWYFEKNWISSTFATMMQLYCHLVAIDVFATAGKVRR